MTENPLDPAEKHQIW